MKIKFTDNQIRELQTCGVPKGLLSSTTIDTKFLLSSYIEVGENDKIVGKLSILDQTNTCKQLATIHESKPNLYILNSTLQLQTIRKYTVPWFYNCIRYSKSNSNTTKGILPFWHFIDSSFNDNLLNILLNKDDTVSFKEYQPTIVLDGIYTDCSGNKLDKLRDILNLATDHSIILILAGNLPFSFCLNKLCIKPKNFIIFNETKNRTVL